MITAAEVLDAAQSLPRAERAEIARELLATLGRADIPITQNPWSDRESCFFGTVVDPMR